MTKNQTKSPNNSCYCTFNNDCLCDPWLCAHSNCYCGEFHDYVDLEDSSINIYNISDEARKIAKQSLLSDWPWLSKVCNPEDIPNDAIDRLLLSKFKINDRVILDRDFVDRIDYVINKFSIGFSSTIGEDGSFTLREENHFDTKGEEGYAELKEEIEGYLADRKLMRDISGVELREARHHGDLKDRSRKEVF